MKEKQLFIIKTEDCWGVLRRAAGVLCRKGHNISSLHYNGGSSDVEITVECSEEESVRMRTMLLKLYDIFDVELVNNV